MRSGQDYLASINDDRTVYVDGQRIRDVADHPAFRPIATRIAELFDLAADSASKMTFSAPETGAEANRLYGTRRSREALPEFRHAARTWPRHPPGCVGRCPDH